MSKKSSQKKIKKLPLILLGIFTLIIVVLSVIISANKLMQYIAIKQRNQVLEDIYVNKLIEIDELKYYINTEVDDEYKEKWLDCLAIISRMKPYITLSKIKEQ